VSARKKTGTGAGEDLAARVELLGAQLIGVTFSRCIARTGRLAQMSPDELREHLIPVLCAPRRD
jgi:hypothetical protein